jgi:RNA polymerase sigma-54 factor
MQMGYGLFQEQSLKLVMTPELRQAITILQLSALDLVEYLNQQMNENPVIEPLDNEPNSHAEVPPERNGPAEMDWKEYFRDHQEYPKTNGKTNENGSNPLDWVVKNEASLEKQLIEQLSYLKKLDQGIKRIAKYIIGNLNDKGYLDLALEQIAATLKSHHEDVEQALLVVQGLEPHGVGARSLKECLAIQLEYSGLKESLMFQIVENHLTDLAEGKINKIANEQQVSLRAVQDAIDHIRTLDPRPGSSYHREEVRYIVPDVTVEKVEGNYVIFVNDSVTPRLSINRFYEQLLQQETEAKKYIQEKMNSALWLIRSIEQRRMTLYRVTEAIVEEQREFFEQGIDFLKPMTLKEIAEIVGLHESTISRATNNKYVQTPRGTYELKYFFTSGLSTSSGEATSSESVKKQLKKIIQQEDRKKPLSDQHLADILNDQGICISRRTVAKYREELGIGSSAKRKRYE